MTIAPFDRFNEDHVAAFHALDLTLAPERSPDDPPPTLAAIRAMLQHIPEFIELHAWQALGEDGAVDAMGGVALIRQEANAHLAQMYLSVRPEKRRQGLGTALLERIVAAAEADGRTALLGDSTSTVPSGEAFLTAVGASVGLVENTNQLVLADVDRAQLTSWQGRAPAGFTLGLWVGPYPEENMDEIVRVWQLMNQVPRGDLNMGDIDFSAEDLRQMEAGQAAHGSERWAMYVRDEASGEIAGYTDVTWSPDNVHVVQQGLTAVWPQYRGKGLGRWLKAAMLEKILTDRPQARFVRTGNADTNAAMLHINQALGFSLYRVHKSWQADTATVRAYLDARRAGSRI